MARVRSTRERVQRLWVSVLLLLVLVIGLHYIGVLRPAEGLVLNMIQPLQSRLYGSVAEQQDTTTDEVSTLSKEELQERYAEIVRENRQLETERTRLQQLVQEADLLAEQRAFLEDRQFRAQTARITSRTIDALSQEVIIDAGTRNEVQEGYPVITNNGVLIGTVVAADEYSSRVRFITALNSQVASAIQNSTNSPGIAAGEHNITLRLQFIPEPDTIEPGMGVTTSGLDTRIPAGLTVGTISEVINQPGSVFQEAVVEPFFEPTTVSIVSVLLP